MQDKRAAAKTTRGAGGRCNMSRWQTMRGNLAASNDARQYGSEQQDKRRGGGETMWGYWAVDNTTRDGNAIASVALPMEQKTRIRIGKQGRRVWVMCSLICYRAR